MPDAEDWVVGMAYYGEIRIVSPNNPGQVHGYDDIMKVAVHEFAHIAANRISTSAPSFLSEGLATYAAGQSEGVAETISNVLKLGRAPSIDELRQLSSENGSYQIGYAFVEYVVAEYGYEKFLELYEKFDIQAVFGKSEDEFLASWIKYLRDTYSK